MGNYANFADCVLDNRWIGYWEESSRSADRRSLGLGAKRRLLTTIEFFAGNRGVRELESTISQQIGSKHPPFAVAENSWVARQGA
jgi:hypothetical protein